MTCLIILLSLASCALVLDAAASPSRPFPVV